MTLFRTLADIGLFRCGPGPDRLRRRVGAGRGGGVVLVVGQQEQETHVAAGPTPTTAPTTTSTTVPPPPFDAADATGSEVHLYDAPGATVPTGSLPNPTVEHVPLASSQGAGSSRVGAGPDPERPNESTARVHSDEVSLRGVDNRIVVQRDEHQITVYRGTTNQVLFQANVADGAAKTPTPLGNFYVDVVVKITQSGGAYGPYELSVAGFSDALQTFDGGPGQIAIHGTNHPELIGKFVSNGCVRLNNDDITALQSLVSTGTPVQIVA